MNNISNEKAVEILEKDNIELSKTLNNDNRKNNQILEEISVNKAAISALQKQIQKKAILKRECIFLCPNDCGGSEFDEFGDVPHCPNCEYSLSDFLPKFCPNCGQKLEKNIE